VSANLLPCQSFETYNNFYWFVSDSVYCGDCHLDLTAFHVLGLSQQFRVTLVQVDAEVMVCGRSALVM
jgi:hypothetical protein